MELLFVTPGLAPFDGAPGAPQVTAALPKALKPLGHSITVIAPLPEGFDLSSSSFSRRLTPLEVESAGRGSSKESVIVFDGRSMGGTQLVFLDHKALASLFEAGDEGLEAQTLFARAVEAFIALEGTFELVHAHDEEAALAAALVANAGTLPVVYTVYETAAPVGFSKAAVKRLGLAPEACQPSSMAARAADFVTTTSPGRAARAVRNKSSELAEALAAQRGNFSGVLIGLDTSVWNSLSDPLLASRFSPHEPHARGRNKAMLQRELELEINPDIPLLGCVEGEVGAERIAAALPKLLRNEVQVAMQILDEDAPIADTLIALSKRYPERFQVRLGDSEKRTHRIVAGSDSLVLTSDDATLAMAAHRYGNVPVVASDTAAAEHCVDIDAKLTTGNAITYDAAESTGLLGAMQRAMAAFQSGEAFEKVRFRNMRIDHSYERAARIYDGIYDMARTREAAE